MRLPAGLAARPRLAAALRPARPPAPRARPRAPSAAPRAPPPPADAPAPLDFAPAAPAPFDAAGGGPGAGPDPRPKAPDAGTLWGLSVLSLAYLHHSTAGFALPALLPIISQDLHLADDQGAALTAGYTVLYALALVPAGLLADRVDRPRMLAVGMTFWSGLTVAASGARSFGELLACRVGFAAAQATQNPICFSLIPELFPNNRTGAFALYNAAIYAGRALSFAALVLAGKLGVPEGAITAALDPSYTLVPLDKVDLSLVSILYVQGNYAAVSSVYTYAAAADAAGLGVEGAFEAWRTLLQWLGPPGLALAVLVLLTVDEPRAARPFTGPPLRSSKFLAAAAAAARAPPPPPRPAAAAAAAAFAPAAVAAPPPGADSLAQSLAKLRVLVRTPAFLALTFSAAFNDVGSWALVAWQATFYQRVFDLQPDVYAPLLAVVIPVGGIVGGVGAGLCGDWLTRVGARGLLTSGANLAAAPVIAVSLLAPDYKQSFAALLVGFALSEAWRAPAAIAVRDVSPPGLGSTGSAVHLCIRNLVGGLGPLAVAALSARVGLQLAMLLIPCCYLASGLGFAATEALVAAERRAPRRAL
jgi:MFS family permease